MKLVLWLAQLQWGITLDRLTYEKLWSVERVSRLLIGCINILLVTLTLAHHSSWLIPLGIINSIVLISSISGFEILSYFLMHLGFKEKDQILRDLKIIKKAKEAINKKKNESFYAGSTSSSTKVFIFDSLESQSVNPENENFIVFSYSDLNTVSQTHTDTPSHADTLTMTRS